jgi:PAS domain S-box-containing protein
MSRGPDPVEVLRDVALLYELSLAAASSLDLSESCERFLRTLMTRRRLGFASVWVHGSALDAEEPDGLHLLHAIPAFRTRETRLPADHPMVMDLAGRSAFSIASGDPSFTRYVTERELSGGTLALFRLQDVGILKMYSAVRTEPLDEVELRKLRAVVDKFAITVAGGIAHRRAMREIERRRGAERALRESEERYRILFEQNPLMYFTLDGDGTVLAVNAPGARQLGWPREELVGRPVLDVFHEEDREAVQEQFRRCLDQPDRTFEWRFRKVTRDGRTIWVEENARSIHGPDGRPRVLVTCQDVTERLEAERERREMERQLQHTQKLESLGVLAGGIAHDFNNILTGVLGNAGLARLDLEAGSEVDRHVEQAEKAALRAADLCRQLLAYSGHGHLEVRAIDLTTEIREAAELLEVSVSRSIALEYELADGLPAIVGDASQIRQVLVNLLTNASDAIGGHNGTIRVRTGPQTCDRDYLADCVGGAHLEPGRYVFVEVEDTGCGLDDETREHIFDPFFTTKVTGRGLGLAAVLGILRGHRGAVRIRSRPQEGSVFRVLFPASAVAAEIDPPPRPPAAGGDPGRTVLLVDDEDIVRQVGIRALERLGHRVLTAGDGIEALEVFREKSREIDVVILDLTMPRLDGAQTLAELRQLDADVPIVLSSGFDEQEASEQIDPRQVAGFLRKPYPIEELSRTVRHALQISAERREPR